MADAIILNTERLNFRKAQISDSHFFFRLMNSEGWLRYIGDRGIKTDKDAEEYIKNKLAQHYETHGYGLYVSELKESYLPIGICGFVKRDYLELPDLGFAILPEYKRKGYSYEAALAAMKYGRNHLGFGGLYAITSPDNVASRRLLEKLGFTFKSEIDEPLTVEKLSLFFSNVVP